MNIEQEINNVIAYLDAQGVYTTNVEFGKLGNGSASLIFKFAKNKYDNQQVKELLAQFAQKSVKITDIRFDDDKENAHIALVNVTCSYDFTQQLNSEEVEHITAAKAIKQKIYKYQATSDGKWERQIQIFTDGKYYASAFYRKDDSQSYARAQGKEYKPISKEEADATDERAWSNKFYKASSC